MNVLCTNCFPQMEIHFVCELELAEEHFARGDTVTFLECNASLPICEINPQHSLLACANCVAVRQHGLALLSRGATTKPFLLDPRRWRMPAFSSLDDVRAFKVEEFFLGEKLASWLMSTEESVHIDLEKYRPQLAKFFQVGMQTYFSALEHLRREQTDKVYIFNGRMVAQAAWVAACKKVGVPFATHERLASMKHFHVVDQSTVHEPRAFRAAMEAFWSVSGHDEAVRAEAREFFEERRRGQVTGWTSFTGLQEKNALPADWAERPERIVIFASTEWEMCASEDLGIEMLYRSQAEVLGWLLPRLARERPEAGICLRVHPNSKKDCSRWWEALRPLALPHLSILEPESRYDSYALLDRATKVISFGSTLGAEATYWGKVSVMFGTTGYSGTGAVWEPRTKEALLEMILDPALPPLPRENTYQYAGFFRAGGRPYRLSEEVNYYTLAFKGHVPRPRREVAAVLARHWQLKGENRLPEPVRQFWERWQFFRLRRRFGWKFGHNFYRKKRDGKAAAR